MTWVQNASPAVSTASNYPTLIAVCVSMTMLMMCIVFLRMYVRFVILKAAGVDDWTVIFSAVCSIIYNALCIGQSRWGLGLPIAMRPPENLNQYSIINFVGRPFYMMGILGFKVALCLAYLRILGILRPMYRRIVWSIMISCVVGHIVGTLVLFFQCMPIQKSWIPLTPGSCLPNVPTFEALAIITILFDVVIFFTPIPLFVQLQINNRRKMALIGMFLLGLFTTVCSILRMTRIPSLAVNGDSTFLILWGTIELNVGISLTCIPSLSPVLPYFREKNIVRHTSRRQSMFSSHELHSRDVIERPSRVYASHYGFDGATDSPPSQSITSQNGLASTATSFENITVPRTKNQEVNSTWCQ